VLLTDHGAQALDYGTIHDRTLVLCR
jgi:hypothetical protein